MQRQILPIVFEDNDPAKIRAAFEAGCGGVIVDGHLPDAVTAELDRLGQGLTLPPGLKGGSLVLSVDAQAQRSWSRDVPELYETCRWLADEYAALAGCHLMPAAPGGGRRPPMTVWPGEGLSLPWHIDKKASHVVYPDTHIHLHGAGMVLAAPPRSLTLLFNDTGGASQKLQIPGSRYIVDSEERLDDHLQDHGCTFIQLRPGQRVYFGEGCLHKSSFTFPPAFKLRAAIF